MGIDHRLVSRRVVPVVPPFWSYDGGKIRPGEDGCGVSSPSAPQPDPSAALHAAVHEREPGVLLHRRPPVRRDASRDPSLAGRRLLRDGVDRAALRRKMETETRINYQRNKKSNRIIS